MAAHGMLPVRHLSAPMQLSLSRSDLLAYVARQLEAVSPEPGSPVDALAQSLPFTLERLEHCFGHARLKSFRQGATVVFDHRHTDQYAAFLYLLSHTAWRRYENAALAARLYALNKALHALDVFYEVELPAIFGFQHPVGTVLGRATYADYFFVYQRCSVGSAIDGGAPVMSPGLVMFGGSSLIGRCAVGSNVWLSVGTTVLDAEVPGDSVVFGASPSLVIKRTARHVVRDIFHDLA